jgi:hypothetical protein
MNDGIPGHGATIGDTDGLTISPRGGPPGTDVAVQMEGLPARTTMMIGFGAPQAGYEWIGQEETDADGRLSATVEVPASAEENRRHYFFVTLPDQPPLGTSDAYHVTAEDGSLAVTGALTAEGSGFVAMRAEFDALYCLIGDVMAEPGRQVTVEGRITSTTDCPDGIAVDVRAVRDG